MESSDAQPNMPRLKFGISTSERKALEKKYKQAKRKPAKTDKPQSH